MKELKAIVVCVVPFIVAALLLYPFMAIVGANFDPFMWERADRFFYMIASTGAGVMLLVRVLHASEEQ
jgi:uncharacterized membrane protein YhaH (DUF805 family)